MDGGSCPLNGGGGREGQGSGMITLEDLESFSEDQLLDSGTGGSEESEMMEDEEQYRLLGYWQEVARGHRVAVPRGKLISCSRHLGLFKITSAMHQQTLDDRRGYQTF